MSAPVPTVHVPRLDREIIAHRGLSSRAPENTLAAFRLAASEGTRWIETDVDILSDGTPILLHDTLLDRTTSKSGRVYDLVAADLENIDAGFWFGPEFEGERIPTLRNLVDFLNESGLNANIEIKRNEEGAGRSRQLVDSVLAELERLDPDREVIISSFSQPVLMHLSQQAPQYALAVLYEAGTFGDDWLSVLELCGARYAHLEDRGLNRDAIRRITDAGFGVNVWTVNNPGRANELFNWGCTGVFTDVSDVLLRSESSRPHQLQHLP